MTPAQSAARLHADLSALRARIATEAAGTMANWEPAIHRGGFRASAGNLADYLAFRSADLRPLQGELAVLGLSSLGRCEAHVRPSLDATIATLAAVAGLPAEPYPAVAAFDHGPDLVEAARDRLFGDRAQGAATRIMVTLPTEAADDPELVARIVAAGADCIRINCAHDDVAAWGRMIAHARAAAAALGRQVRISMDLGGPKIRTREIAPQRAPKLFRGDRFAIVHRLEDAPQGLPCASLSHGALIDALRPGAELWIDDGKLGARVLATDGNGAVLEVFQVRERGLRLKPEKGVNVPGLSLAIPALTEADIAALDFVVAEADVVGFSFVQTPQDVADLLAAMAARRAGRPLPAIMLKVETQLAVNNLPRLIVRAGAEVPVAVMIARGDLAVELGMDRTSEIQEEILWLCEAAHVPVVWATQVLESLLKEGRASRAEVTDAAMGQRAECVMLNKGAHMPEGIAFLGRVLARMDRHQGKKTALLGPLNSWRGPQDL